MLIAFEVLIDSKPPSQEYYSVNRLLGNRLMVKARDSFMKPNQFADIKLFLRFYNRRHVIKTPFYCKNVKSNSYYRNRVRGDEEKPENNIYVNYVRPNQ